MKKDYKNSMENTPSGITRKDAINKMGKYAALTAVGTFIILNPKKQRHNLLLQTQAVGSILFVI